MIRAQSSQELEFNVTAAGAPATADVRVDIEGHESDPARSRCRQSIATWATNSNATVHLTLRGDAVGTTTLGALATADGLDADDDQAATAYVRVTPLADAAVELAAAAGNKVAGTAYSYTATVRNNGPDAAEIRAGFTVSGASVSAATTASGTCTVTSSSADCTLNSLPSGTSTTINYTVNAAVAGNVTANVSVSIDGNDTASANNAVNLAIAVAAPSPPGGGAGSGGGGGGGRFDWLAAGLLGLLLARRKISARAHAA